MVDPCGWSRISSAGSSIYDTVVTAIFWNYHINSRTLDVAIMFSVSLFIIVEMIKGVYRIKQKKAG